MKLVDSLLPLKNTRSSAAFYSRNSPFRDNVFLGTSFILLADLFMAGVILIKDWSHIPIRVAFYVVLVLFGLVSQWGWAVKSHRDVHALIESGQLGNLNGPVNRSLSVSANMTYLALFYTFLLVGICLMALGESLNAG